LKLKFQTVAEKTEKNFRGYFILPHLVYLEECLLLWHVMLLLLLRYCVM